MAIGDEDWQGSRGNRKGWWFGCEVRTSHDKNRIVDRWETISTTT